MYIYIYLQKKKVPSVLLRPKDTVGSQTLRPEKNMEAEAICGKRPRLEF